MVENTRKLIEPAVTVVLACGACVLALSLLLPVLMNRPAI
jgi:type II secretory pathway component PulF